MPKAVALAAGVALLAWVSRGQTFVQDEWDVIQYRLPTSNVKAGFLIPHNQHLLAFDFVLYKAVFAVAGLHHYWPYQLVDLLAHLIAVGLLFEVARRRVGASLAYFVVLPTLVVGAAWEVVLIPFDEQWVISVAAMLGVVLLLDRSSRRNDFAISLLLVVAVASSSFGPVLAAGVLARMLWDSDRWRRLWTALVPLAIYALWYFKYGIHAQTQPGYAVTARPGFLLDVATGSVAALLGAPLDAGALAHRSWLLAPFRLLTIGVFGALAYALVARKRRLTPDLSMLLVILVLYFVLLTLSRGYLHNPFTPTYIYVGEVVILLVGLELSRRRRIPSGVRRSVVAIACLVTLLNAGILVYYANKRRHDSAIIAAEVGALQVARHPALSPTFQIDTNVARAPALVAGGYFAAIDALHTSPAPSPSGIMAEPEYARAAADGVLVRAFNVRVIPVTPSVRRFLALSTAAAGPGVRVERSADGTATPAGRCERFRPSGAGGGVIELSGQQTSLGAAIETRAGAPVAVRLRRFAQTFPAMPLATVYGPAFIPTPAGNAPQPWHLQLTAHVPLEVCLR